MATLSDNFSWHGLRSNLFPPSTDLNSPLSQLGRWSSRCGRCRTCVGHPPTAFSLLTLVATPPRCQGGLWISRVQQGRGEGVTVETTGPWIGPLSGCRVQEGAVSRPVANFLATERALSVGLLVVHDGTRMRVGGLPIRRWDHESTGPELTRTRDESASPDSRPQINGLSW